MGQFVNALTSFICVVLDITEKGGSRLDVMGYFVTFNRIEHASY